MFLVTLVTLVCCSKERPLQSPPTKYLLYVGMGGRSPLFTSYVLVADCATDSVIDSLGSAGYYNHQLMLVRTSPDGRYLFLGFSTGGARIWDIASHAEIRNLGIFALRPIFVPKARSLVVFQPDSSHIYSIPDFTLVGKLPEVVGSGSLIPGTTRIVTIRQRSSSPPDVDFLTYDVVARSFVDSLRLQAADLGPDLYLFHWVYASELQRLYAICTDSIGTCLIGYDLRARRLLFRSPAAEFSGRPWLNATCDQVWVTYGTTSFGGPWPSYVSIYDGQSGAELERITPSRNLPGWGFAPGGVAFHPAGNKVYIQGATEDGQTQPVIAITTPGSEVQKVLFGDHAHLPVDIALGIDPRP
jgi:hypothetical protein